MVEIALEEFEDFYKEKINEIFFKIRKAIRKIIEDIRSGLIDIKICMDHFLDSSEKIDQKSLRSLNLFSDRIKSYVDEVIIPDEEDINYNNLNELLNSIKKLFKSINEIARKSLPKFQKQVQPEIKELNYKTRKLQKKNMILDRFLRKKYTDVKNAEDLLEKLPKISSLRENIQNARLDLDNLEKEVKEKEELIEKLNKELIALEKSELFKELDTIKQEEFQLKITIGDKIGFKKALKKFKHEIEKSNLHVSNVDINYIRDFLKSPINALQNERQDLPKFTASLVQLRRTLEENKLNLKSETKEKTIEQINEIFESKEIQNDIEKLNEINDKIKQIKEKIKKAGLADKLESIKNEISINSVKLEHTQTDLERRNKDYNRYLNSLKEEREGFQELASQVLEEPVKLTIKFDF